MTEKYLHGLMKRYTTDHLVGITPEDFKARIDEFLALEDYEMEGYKSPDKQRDKSVKFHWGHNHDFGTFRLEGAMGNRHIGAIAKFIEMGLPRDLTGKRVLDIGVWTGGTSLLLAAMGASVLAVEEVGKYHMVIEALSHYFNISLDSYCKSLYDHWHRDNYFDYVSFPGVLYHLTDPILALRIIFNSLRDGGMVFIETMRAPDNTAKTLQYHGPSEPGWNWFAPTTSVLLQMMLDVGFEDVRVEPAGDKRAYAVGTRKRHKDMLRAGLSRSDIR